METPLQPRFITFDMMGTLIKLEWRATALSLIDGVIAPEDQDRFIYDFSSFRNNEIIGTYRDYPEIIRDSWQRTCNHWKIQFKQTDVDVFMDALQTWGPQPDVVEPLKRLAAKYPLAIFTNHCDALVMKNVETLGVEFHRVFTAEQAQAYKPHLAAFEYMLDQLDAKPTELLHVSSHLWHDWIPAEQIGITHQAYIDRGFDPHISWPGAYTDTLAGIADRVGA